MEIQTLTTQDFENICRICLKMGELYSLQKYLNTLKIIINIEDTSLQELPQNICINCTQFLESLEKFIKTFVSNEAILNKILTEYKLIKEENIVSDYEDRQSSEDEQNSSRNLSSELNKLIKEEIIVSDYEDRQSSGDEQNSRNLSWENLSEFEQSSVKNKQRKNTFQKEDRVKKKRTEECMCNICGNKFTRLGGLKRHMKIHMGIKPYSCKICDKSFVEKATLLRHNLVHTDKKPFECSLCGKASRRRDQTIEHIQKRHSNVTDFNLYIVERERPNIEKITGTDNNIVKKEDITKSKEISETKCKSKKRIEICLCNLCGKMFKRREYLKNHMAVHAKVKPFKCNICEKTFTQRHVLTRHNLVHTKERPYQCNLCGKTFTRKEILTEHISNHDGSKPHLCFHCGKSFTNKYYLTKHIKYYLAGKNKKSSNDKKCNCPHCGKELHSASYLKTHLLIHTGEKPFECNICGQKFTTQQRLNSHLNIHKGLKPYTCTQCEKSFRTSNSLQKHRLLHTGERPFKCSSCDKGFIRRSHLKRHFRTH